jgi:hypothetical protein
MSKEEQNLFPYIRQTIREIKYNGKNDNAILQSLKKKYNCSRLNTKDLLII